MSTKTIQDSNWGQSLNCVRQGQSVSPVWGEDDGASLFNDAVYAVPEGAASFGVHASRGLVL